MKNLIKSIWVFIIINILNYAFWSLVCWEINFGNWGWVARLIAIIIFLSALSVIKISSYRREKLERKENSKFQQRLDEIRNKNL